MISSRGTYDSINEVHIAVGLKHRGHTNILNHW